MPEISHIQSSQPARLVNPAQREFTPQTQQSQGRSLDRADKLDLSPDALQRLRAEGAQMNDGAPVRADLIARVRAEIASDTYLTQERIDKAAEALAREITRNNG